MVNIHSVKLSILTILLSKFYSISIHLDPALTRSAGSHFIVIPSYASRCPLLKIPLFLEQSPDNTFPWGIRAVYCLCPCTRGDVLVLPMCFTNDLAGHTIQGPKPVFIRTLKALPPVLLESTVPNGKPETNLIFIPWYVASLNSSLRRVFRWIYLFIYLFVYSLEFCCFLNLDPGAFLLLLFCFFIHLVTPE